MKNILLLSFIVLFASPVFTQTRAPKKIRVAFEEMVTEAQSIKWSTPEERIPTKDRKYTVNYTIKDDSLFSRFDYKANWLLTVTYIPIDELPESVTNSINSNYMGAELKKAARLETPDFDGYGVLFIYMKDQWTIQISKEGEFVRRNVKNKGFQFD